MCRVVVIVALICGLLVWTPAAGAQPSATGGTQVAGGVGADPGVTPTHSVAQAVTLQAGPTCLDEARLERRVAKWLERDEIGADITVAVTGGPAENQARFLLRRGEASPTERNLSDVPGDCGDQHSAVALSIALAIDASLLSPLPPEEEEPTPPKPPKLQLPRPQEGESPPVFAISAGVGIGVEFLTEVAPLVLLALHLEPVPGLELRATGRWTGEFGNAWPEAGSDRIRYSDQMWLGGLAACPVVRPLPALSASACVEVLGGVFRTSASGLLRSQSQTGPYWAAAIGLDFRAHFTRSLGIRLMADLVLPFTPRRLRIADPSGDTVVERDFAPSSLFLGLAPYLAF